MTKRWYRCLLLCLCLCLPTYGRAESGEVLSRRGLQAIQPAYEAFLEQLADLLIQEGQLDAQDRQDWMDIQLGDYLQNGGYGSIVTMYTPGLVHEADQDMMLCRMRLETQAGRLYVDTLRAYVLQSSMLPGLPLEAGMEDEQGTPIPCRFRWRASSGLFTVWDSVNNTAIYTGATCISVGRAVYWQEDPVGSGQEKITLEVLAQEVDEVIATACFTLQAGDRSWTVQEDTLCAGT
ncbi:MAG: hypothetical protein RR482_03705 [Clostridia bacterium]